MHFHTVLKLSLLYYIQQQSTGVQYCLTLPEKETYFHYGVISYEELYRHIYLSFLHQ
jgi:hypothetical protein